MFLKKTWNKLGISSKLFCTSSILVIITTIMVYSALYGFFPRAYSFYKLEKAKAGVSQIIYECRNDPNIGNMFTALNQFSYDNNVDLLVKNENGIIYISNRFFQKISSDKFTPDEESVIESKFDSGGIIKKINFHSNSLNCNLTLEVRIPIEPIDQISRVMLIFLPIIIGITILISMISAFLYSRAAAKPLLEINNVAKSMSKLDFSKKLKVQGDDELAELSASLNEMSDSLERNIRELEETNKKLLSDIEKERIEEKKRRELIGTISHELKSPITIVTGQLEGMMYNIGAFKDRDKYLKKSHDVMEEMRDLVGEILELNKYESNAFNVEMEKVNFSNMVNVAIEKQAFYIKQKSINIKANINEKIFIYADAKLIKKVLDNIISNAIKYSDEKETVYIDLRIDEDVIFEVKNKSEQITDEEISKIFNPFYRIEKSRNRKTGGSGLGLFIVKNILDKHTNMSYKMESNNGMVSFKLNIQN